MLFDHFGLNAIFPIFGAIDMDGRAGFWRVLPSDRSHQTRSRNRRIPMPPPSRSGVAGEMIGRFLCLSSEIVVIQLSEFKATMSRSACSAAVSCRIKRWPAWSKSNDPFRVANLHGGSFQPGSLLLLQFARALRAFGVANLGASFEVPVSESDFKYFVVILY